jgi:hypothetical protein
MLPDLADDGEEEERGLTEGEEKDRLEEEELEDADREGAEGVRLKEDERDGLR